MSTVERIQIYDQVDQLRDYLLALSHLGCDAQAQLLSGTQVSTLLDPAVDRLDDLLQQLSA